MILGVSSIDTDTGLCSTCSMLVGTVDHRIID